jgi:four helix bundle protein
MLRSFQELEAWKKAHLLALEVYRLTRSFPREEQYGLTSQLRRSASSVAANIAEGFGRRSTKDFMRYLEIASGSLEEARSYLLLARDLGYLKADGFTPVHTSCDETGRLLGGLSRSLRKHAGV